ncbi:MAG: hypothetical protein IJW70_03380 [Clostridia bacterium]|nr:hypothetical protein [Clostridia bacterium]
MQYLIQNNKLRLEYDPEELSLCVHVEGSDIMWSWADAGKIRLGDGTELLLKKAKCQSCAYQNGVMDGVRATYTGLCDAAGREYAFSVETYVALEKSSGQLRVQAWVVDDARGQIAALEYPPRMKFDAAEGDGYTVLPRMQGTLVPAGHPIKIVNGFIYERDGYMPLYGQVNKGCGYAAIYDTPYDARYALVGEEVQPFFIPSLGTMSYKREMIFAFFADGDFNTIAKIYRAYRKERGKLVTLKEKIAKNPNVEYLIGTPIVHTIAAVHIKEGTHYYDPQDPAHNDWCIPFAKTAEGLQRLKNMGVEKAYLHLDGWGHHGYDNLHPSPFPVHEEAGGADGMRELSNTCRELGYKFGIHDQYRDYYYDSPGFTLDNAVQYYDGNHFLSDYWYGGAHTFLCSVLAPDYVRRNYDEFESLGIKIDGSYLDVFSVVELDECFNPEHPATREQCAANRRRCLDILTSRGIIPSSEETLDCIIESMALCHHAPFHCTSFDAPDKVNVGVPIPLFNLVYHDCIVIPWDGMHRRGAWGIACTDQPYLWALLCGNTVYYFMNMDKEEVEYGKIALELFGRVAHCDLTKHEILDATTRKRRSTFSDGTVVEADFDSGEFTITYPDGKVVSGKD